MRALLQERKKIKVVSISEQANKNAHDRLYFIENKKSLKINEVSVGDRTYIPMNNKFLYLSAVMDISRRKILG